MSSSDDDFTKAQVNGMMAAIGIAGFLLQIFVVPLCNRCGVGNHLLTFFALVSNSAQYFFYAFVKKYSVLIEATPLLCFGQMGQVSVVAIISGNTRSETKSNEQGTLLGVLSCLKGLACTVGPIVLATCNTFYSHFPHPLNFSGVGYAGLGALMLPAVLLAIKTLPRDCKKVVDSETPMAEEAEMGM